MEKSELVKKVERQIKELKESRARLKQAAYNLFQTIGQEKRSEVTKRGLGAKKEVENDNNRN